MIMSPGINMQSIQIELNTGRSGDKTTTVYIKGWLIDAID